jgi:hypothetical protein
MVVNALNSGAKVFMADFEDATTPSWNNLLDGQRNLYDAVRRGALFDFALFFFHNAAELGARGSGRYEEPARLRAGSSRDDRYEAAGDLFCRLTEAADLPGVHDDGGLRRNCRRGIFRRPTSTGAQGKAGQHQSVRAAEPA